MNGNDNLKSQYNSPSLGVQNLTISLQKNINIFKNIFSKDDTLRIRNIENKSSKTIKCAILSIEGMVDNNFVSESIIKPILYSNLPNIENRDDLLNILLSQVITSTYVEKSNDMHSIIGSITNGNSIFLLDGCSDVLIINSKGWKMRSVTEPSSEKVIRGPREGFTESLLINLSLIRRKIQNPNLKFQFKEIGKETRTRVCICYIEGVASNKILNELNSRLDEIAINSVLDSQYIQEMITDAPLSAFETIGSSERPDVIAGKLLEGRFALIVDGTPFALTLPFLFMEYFQNNEDYYNNFMYTSFNRILRIIAFLFSISVPAIYLSLVTYNQEILPTPLILSISAAREGVPLPTILESIVMLLVFEILREAGTRIPTDMGQAVSIVGALVLGQAAVEARMVSAPMVIVVALTGIVGLLNIRMKALNILLRTIFLILSAFLGMYGYLFGIVGVIIYIMGLSSFGVPYMLTIGSIKMEYVRDSFIRAPWWYVNLRPFIISTKTAIKRRNKGDSNEKK